ncbi:MAG: carboxypeptidase regulatory-like domain-containing protein [Planctomycetes bacterium]|nr:carboxypeptidase regulatory-like domain-containing protein [Planctomycetota bacterium]
MHLTKASSTLFASIVACACALTPAAAQDDVRPLWTPGDALPAPVMGLPLPSRVRDADGVALPSITFTGRVVDAAGASVVGARVRIAPNGATLARLGARPEPFWEFVGLGVEGSRWADYIPWARVPVTTTDAQGRFALDVPSIPVDVERGETKAGMPEPVLVIEWDGCATLTERLGRLDLGGFAPQVDLGERVLAAEGVVRGRVVDDAGRPLAGASVVARWFGGPYGASERMPAVVSSATHGTTTDVEGRFTLGRLPRSAVTLGVSAPGFVATEVALDAGPQDAASTHEVRLQSGATLAGCVVDPSGRPVADARVFATERPTEYVGHGCVLSGIDEAPDRLPIEIRGHARPGAVTGRTDASGHFALAGLPPGAHAVTVYAFGDGLEPGAVRDVPPGSSGVTLVVAPARDLVVRVFSDDGGTPPVDARLEAFRLTGAQNEREPLRVTSGTDGAFVVHGVGPHELLLRAGAPGFVRTERTLVVADGPDVLEFALPRGRPCAGTIVDDRGRPLPDASILVTAIGETGVRGLVSGYALSDASGDFVVQGPDAMELVVSAPGHVTRTFTAPPSVPIIPLVAELPRTASLHVRLVDAEEIAHTSEMFFLERDKGGVAEGIVVRPVWRFAVEGDAYVLRDLPPGVFRFAFNTKNTAELVTLRPGDDLQVELDDTGHRR